MGHEFIFEHCKENETIIFYVCCTTLLTPNLNVSSLPLCLLPLFLPMTTFTSPFSAAHFSFFHCHCLFLSLFLHHPLPFVPCHFFPALFCYTFLLSPFLLLHAHFSFPHCILLLLFLFPLPYVEHNQTVNEGQKKRWDPNIDHHSVLVFLVVTGVSYKL